MSNVKIRNQPIDVDLRAELEQFNWTRLRWNETKLIAASPFRYDQTPSFFVNLEHGGWSDSGAYDAEWQSGGFVKLLSFLRNETTEETEDYLLGEYGVGIAGEEMPILKPNLHVGNRQPTVLSADHLAKHSVDYAYLKRRGISEEVQRSACVRFDSQSRAVVLPWFDEQNRLRNVKYRTTYGKTFWYHKGATPIRDLVYGVETIDGPTAVLCEAEIDALSWRQAGVQAIAVGGANFTHKQADIIKRSAIQTLYIGGDNDKVGRKFNKQVVAKLSGFVELRTLEMPKEVKDANEALVGGVDLRQILSNSIVLQFGKVRL